jgi:hypothetical protein
MSRSPNGPVTASGSAKGRGTHHAMNSRHVEYEKYRQNNGVAA